MGWIASLKGSVDHLDREVAEEAEVAVRDALAAVVGGLVPNGHQGVGGQFHFSHGGPSNLADPAGPGPDVEQAATAQTNPVSTIPAEVKDTGVPAGTAP